MQNSIRSVGSPSRCKHVHKSAAGKRERPIVDEKDDANAQTLITSAATCHVRIGAWALGLGAVTHRAAVVGVAGVFVCVWHIAGAVGTGSATGCYALATQWHAPPPATRAAPPPRTGHIPPTKRASQADADSNDAQRELLLS